MTEPRGRGWPESGRQGIDLGYGTTLLDKTRYDPTNSNNGANYWPGPRGHEYLGETMTRQALKGLKGTRGFRR